MESEELRIPAPAEVEQADSQSLPERLGFCESQELQQLRPYLVEAMALGDAQAVQELGAHYYAVAEEIINRQSGDAFAKAQIGLQVAMALMRREAGRTQEYLEDIGDTLSYAAGMGFNDVVEALGAEDLL